MVEQIISGGQTGADRAALDFAIGRGIGHGGWCPQGRAAEDGVIDRGYRLSETPDSDPSQRTEWNVRDSDGTVIFSVDPILTGGSKKTAEFAEKFQKPWLHLCHKRDGDTAAEKLSAFLAEHRIKTLNVAGPRQSEEPEIGEFVTQTLMKIQFGR